jgi:nitrogen fixation protein
VGIVTPKKDFERKYVPSDRVKDGWGFSLTNLRQGWGM